MVPTPSSETHLPKRLQKLTKYSKVQLGHIVEVRMTHKFTITHSDESLKSMQEAAIQMEIPIEKTIRVAQCIGVDLIDAQKCHGLAIIFRDNSGNEWSYSVDHPGSAALIRPPEPPGGNKKPRTEGNVLYFNFGKK